MKRIISTASTSFIQKTCLLLLLIGLGFTIPPAQAQDKSEQGNTNSTYTIVEQMPAYPGGQDSLMRFLADNVRYPMEAQKAKEQGTVYVNFIVAKDGKVVEVAVIKGVSKTCDDEALRVIKLMPNWEPGRQKGRTVAVRYTLPIRFKL